MAGCFEHGTKQNVREIFVLAQELSISEEDNSFFFCGEGSDLCQESISLTAGREFLHATKMIKDFRE
jgi:hypothetical protein